MNKLPNGWQIKTLSEVCSPSSSNIAFKDVKDKKRRLSDLRSERHCGIFRFLF